MRYYECGKYEIWYATKALFRCDDYIYERHLHCGKGSWNTGEIVRVTKKIDEIIVNKNITKIIQECTVTKLKKGIKAECPFCGKTIKFIGWRVWVTIPSKRSEYVRRFIYQKYCKTLKTRRATIDRLLKKYGDKK